MGHFTGRRSRKRPVERAEPQLFTGRSRVPETARKPRRKRRSLFGGLVRFAVVLAFWGVFVAAGGFLWVWMSLDQKGLFHIPDRAPGIMLLAADGSVLAEEGAFFGDEVRLGELPDYVPNAVIAIEDRRFRNHYGIDPWGLGRAMLANLQAGRIVQGGSTITQQLAKNLFLKPERTFERKVQEMVLAIWLETRFSKDEILQLYLNRVYFGSGATGIGKAAQAYYGKEARELTITEAATLAGVLKAPATYNPSRHPEAAAERSRLVIKSMVDAGFVTASEAQRAANAPATVQASDYVPATRYVTDWVIDQLPQLVKNYGESIVIETTIDPDVQARAERALRIRLNEEGAKQKVTQGAMVVMSADGAVRALVGGKSYKRSQYNRAVAAKRQPGSAFKPFVYLAALENGYSADSVEIDEPVRIGNWQPENYRRKYLGPVTLEKAFALSLNTISAKLTSYVGPEAVAQTARRLGITSPLGNDASIALGTSEVSLLELTSAIAPFANGGEAAPPHVVTRITTRDGEMLYQRFGGGLGKVVSLYDVGAMNRLMRAVIREGTATRAQFGAFDLAGKTGTSQDYRDAWFVGYSAYYVTGVWVGNDDNSPTAKVTGGSIPAEIWRDVMAPIHDGLPARPLPGDSYDGGEDPSEQIAMNPDGTGFDAGDDEEFLPRRGGGGLLEALGELFGGSSGEEPEEGRTTRQSEKSIY